MSWLLCDFGTRSGTIDAAKYSLTAAQLDGNQTLQDLILEVEAGLLPGTRACRRCKKPDLQSVQDATANLDNANQRKSSGLATIGDVYQAEAALATAKLGFADRRRVSWLPRAAPSPSPWATRQTARYRWHPGDSQVTAVLPQENIHDL